MDIDRRDLEADLVRRLRAGDERAFGGIVDQYYGTMLSVARGYVSSTEAAEDVVQDTFLGIVQGIDRFEERSSFKTWMFRILVNRARTRGEREGRSRPFSSLVSSSGGDDREPAVDPDRFEKQGRWAGFWCAPPSQDHAPEARALRRELGQRLTAALTALPDKQRVVVELRDVAGFTSQEVCTLLEVSEANQRVLLHRGRSKLRASLEDYLDRRVTAT